VKPHDQSVNSITGVRYSPGVGTSHEKFDVVIVTVVIKKSCGM
jgi:hypothetical protein